MPHHSHRAKPQVTISTSSFGAVHALGNTQLKVYHKLLSTPGTRYQDLGADYYDRQASTRRQIAHHVGKLSALGFEVTLCRIPSADPDPSEPANTHAA